MSRKTKRRPQRTADSFQNSLARLGFGMPNLMNSTQYPLTRLSQDYNLMNSLYRNHWIVRKIVDTIPEDMCKNWIQLNTQEDPAALKQLEKAVKNTRTRARILDGLKWGRLYGGAAGIILLDGQGDMLAEPLNYDLIMPGDYKGLLILDRWSGVSPGVDMVEDLSSPDFGLPRTYQITLKSGKAYTVHHSRVLRFTGDALPAWASWSEQQWGASVIESVFDELKKRDNTSFNIANLVFLANLRVYKTDMAELIGFGTPQIQQDFYNFMETMNYMMNNSGMSVIGKDDDFTTHQYSFGGINDIYESFMLDVAGACGIPVTRLFGRSPAGFNATGESDLTNYYDSIEEKQAAVLSPILDKLLPVIALSTWGYAPEELDYAYNPLRRADPKENADLSKSFGDAVINAYGAGLISQRTALKELRQQSEVTGMWTNITDEDIEKASDELDMMGADMPMPGMEELMGSRLEANADPALTSDAEWREEDHPRRKDGKFGKGGGAAEKNEEKPKKEETTGAKSGTMKKGSFGGADTKAFTEACTKAKRNVAARNPDIAWRVTDLSQEEFDDEHPDARCHVTPGGSTVAVTTDGDIVSVCRNPGDSVSGDELIQIAVKAGGVKLDSYEGNHKFYIENGFEPVSWCKWDDSGADEGWLSKDWLRVNGLAPDISTADLNKIPDSALKAKREDIIFYRYTGRSSLYTEAKDFKKAIPACRDYGEAMSIRDKSV